MKKNSLITLTTIAIAALALAVPAAKASASTSSTTKTTYSANIGKYGAKAAFTTPKSMRGTWYYKGTKALGLNPKKTYKIKITAHTIKGVYLYKANDKVTEKYAMNYKKYQKVINKTSNWGAASTFKAKGKTWVNVQGWAAGAGNGTFYSVTTKKVNGKRVKTLTIGYGYKPFIGAHAYKK
ncbi:hypothetical protein [Lactobacillus corticis]|uniref:Uncharacterized protein n=1 Tax=Lactobacillus corticis TaxID=2201249 RepID=A0A916QFJ2_9LACO|nr:hypothetical protein [Lactobacillus corticis]GFZ26375.1 hypothetical protein LCB40_02550 [Lactobacillus corticis]